MKRLIFYNHFGHGDVFESREFVRAWMHRVTADEYLYAHGKSPDLITDIPGLGFTPVTDRMHGMTDIKADGDDLLVNTWIGRDGKYVLPGIGCTVEKLYEMHNDMLAKVGLPALDRPIQAYIPNIRYQDYDTNPVYYIQRRIATDVLICNGPAQSGQAANFNLDPAIQILCDAYPDKTFIITQPCGVAAPNLIDASPLNLNQISYLSRFCDVIVGRNSGPHVFSQVYDNWRDHDKHLVCFTYEKSGASFVHKPEALGLKMQLVWSPTTDPVEAAAIIAGCL